MSESLKLSNQLCFPVYVLSKEIINRYRPFLDELDLTYPQYLVLMVLWEQDNQTVSALGEKLYLDSGTLTPLLKRLESKEMVMRTRQKNDERVVQISLTPSGLALKEKAICIPLQMMESMDLTKQEVEQFKQLITKILSK